MGTGIGSGQNKYPHGSLVIRRVVKLRETSEALLMASTVIRLSSFDGIYVRDVAQIDITILPRDLELIIPIGFTKGNDEIFKMKYTILPLTLHASTLI